MPRTNVRKHPTKSSDEPSPARGPPVVASKVKVQQAQAQHTAPASSPQAAPPRGRKRGGRTHAEPELPKAPSTTPTSAPEMKENIGSVAQAAQRPPGTAIGLGVPSTGAAPQKRKVHRYICHSYLHGRCSKPECPRRHPQNPKPCRNFARGTCRIKACARPHILPHPHHADPDKDADPAIDMDTESATDIDSVQVAVSDEEEMEMAEVETESHPSGSLPSSPPPQAEIQPFDPHPQSSDDVCRNFQRGYCRWGRRCHRRHEAPYSQVSHAGVTQQCRSEQTRSTTGERNVGGLGSFKLGFTTVVTPTPHTAIKAQQQQSSEVCKKYMQGRCQRGQQCRYMHPSHIPAATGVSTTVCVGKTPATASAVATSNNLPPTVTEPSQDDESRLPCIMYMTRNMKCIYGRECHRLHPPVCDWKKYLGQSDEICEQFLEGDCWLGENCWRRHPGAQSATEEAATTLPVRIPEVITSCVKPLEQLVIPSDGTDRKRTISSAATTPETSPLLTDDALNPDTRPVCWNFLRGRCLRQACKYAHVESKPPQAPRLQPLTASSSWSSTDTDLRRDHKYQVSDHRSIEAKLNRLLSTFRGSSQRPNTGQQRVELLTVPVRGPTFVVQPTKPIPLLPPGLGLENGSSNTARSAKPPPETMSINVLDAVHVLFGPGIQVHHVKTGFESRVVLIKGVPSKKTAGDITRILQRFGEVSEVHLPAVRDAPTMTVRATFPTYDAAVKAVAGLDNQVVFGATVQLQLASQHSTALGKGSVQDGDVRLEFSAPFRVAYLGYATESAAEQAIAKINATEIGDCELEAFLHRGVPSVARFTVKVLGLPPDTQEADLVQFSPVGRPMLDRPNYPVLKDALHDLFRTARQHGDLLKITVLAPPFPRQRILAWAHYASPEGAARAAKALNNRRFKFLGSELLSATHTRTINYTLPRDVFKALLYDLVALRSHLRAGRDDCSISWFDKRGGMRDAPPVGVKLAASKLNVLTRIKSSFDALLRGDRLIVDGQNVWDPFFATRAGAIYFEQLQQKYPGVLISRDPRKCLLTLFGPPAARRGVRNSIMRKIEHLRTQIFHSFPLNGRLIGLFISADLMKLQQELGHDNVALDFANQSLKIRGDDDALRVTRLILRHAQERHDRHRPHLGQSCPVCLDDVNLPVTLPCGHSWCKSCLEGYLLATVDTRVFPVTCLGNEGRCGTLVPIHVAKEILRPEKFFDVVRASFLSYIHSRPDEFFYCPTPDCPQVYRSAAADTVLQCPSCLVRICAKCHVESHDGTTCARREAEDKRLFQQWSSTRDVKNCPGCKIPIERISGCNHIACTSCKAHICWVCLSTFKESGQVYEHMHNEHGGIGLEYWF